jgi:hypothetical protein
VVAVRDKEVVVSGKSFERVVACLKEYDRRNAIMEYVQLEQFDLVF